MGYTLRQFASSLDSLGTYDSTTLGPGSYATSANIPCNVDTIGFVMAVKGAGPVVQGNSFASAAIGGVSSAVLAFTNPNTAGNCIIVTAMLDGTFPGNSATCADSAGNSYTLVSGDNVAGYYLWTFIAFGAVGSANTVTVSFTGLGVPGGAYTIAINEYARGTAVDAFTIRTLLGGGSLAMASLTTTASNDLLYFAIGCHVACVPNTLAGGNPLLPPTPPTAWLIVGEPSIGLTDRTSYLANGSGSHSFNLQLRQRGKASYTLVSDPSNSGSAPTGYQPTVGQPIYLYDQNLSGYTLMFAGLVQDFTERFVGNHGLRFIDVTAVSLESVLDTIYAQPMQFVNQTCGAIVTALFNAFENGSQVSLGVIQAGATIPLFNANLGDKLSDLFDQLATTSQFVWGVNPQNQQLFFQLPTVTAAPFTVASANVLWDSISRKYDAGDYRNRQGVKLSFDAFSHSEEYFVGAGQTAFTLMRPVEQVVGAYVTTATQNSATASFSGQPSPGDTVTVGPATGAWQQNHIYGLGGVIVINGFVQKVTTAGTSNNVGIPTFSTITGGVTGDGTVIWTCQGPLGLGTGQTTYTFVSAIDNTQFGQVLIGATLAITVQNLVDALNAVAPYSGTPATKGRGLTFSLPTWENSQVNAGSVTGTGFTVKQKIPGSGPVAGLTSVGSAFAWSAANTSGGTSPQTSVGPNEGAWISIAVYVVGTATSAPGLAYTPGSTAVNLATPLNAGTNLVVEYTRTDGDVIEVENTALVTALAAVSGGTGKYQQFTDQSSTGLIATNAAAGLQLAQEILATYATVPQELTIELYRPGLLPGQQLPLSLSSPLNILNGSYFIESVDAELVPVPTLTGLDSVAAANAGHYRYTVKLININQIGTALDLWRLLGGSGGTAGGGGLGSSLVATSGSTGSTTGAGLVMGGVNKQTTSYAAVAGDNGMVISVNAAGATTLTLPSPPPFAQWCIFVENIGAGTLTVSRNGLNIDGAASNLTVLTNQGTYITTDGTNYFTGTRGLGLSNPLTTKGDVIVAATGGVPARLAVGTNGQVLTSNSGATNGVDWEAPIALTTTGSSGPATLTPGTPYTLNVPQYSGGSGPSITSGVFASLPGSPNNGDLYLFTNSLYDMATFQSSAWVYLKDGKVMTPPTGFSWMNQSTASLTTTGGGEALTAALGANASNWNIRYVAYPSAPFTRTAVMRIAFVPSVGGTAPNNCSAGLVLSDGTQVESCGFYGVNVPKVSIQFGTTATNITTNVQQTVGWTPGQLVWLRMDDGVTSAGKRTFWISYDGQEFFQILQESNTNRLTPTRIGYFVSAFDTGANTTAWVLSWS